MRVLSKTLPLIVLGTTLLGTSSVWAQNLPQDPDPTWRQQADGTTAGWQGDVPKPYHAPMRPINAENGTDGDGGYTNDGGRERQENFGMQEHHQGDVTFISGGVGLDESRRLLQESHHYALTLSFFGTNHEYLSDVAVRIEGSNGAVLHTRTRGPFLLAQLPPGRYRVYASYHGHEQSHAVAVGARGHSRSTFTWPTHDSE